ncbi:MAG: SDR family NAD(P)-dependent oxidoreductase, partial [Chloroflexota bacterium]|nr:SDR family NAD(P)-dependent oxidoreductase [Chloroflexota bacterium]
ACSKAALMRFTETLAAELEDTGVKVFAMSPGLVRTELVEHQISSPEGQKWRAGDINSRLAEGGAVPPTLGANLALLLVSGRADKLVGRGFRATEDMDGVLRRTDEILAKDLRVLRMVGYN